MPGFDLFDPSQWVNPAGLAIIAVVATLSLVGAFAKLAAGGRWADWLDEVHGRGSIDDRWDE